MKRGAKSRTESRLLVLIEAIHKRALELPTVTETERMISAYWVGAEMGLREARNVMLQERKGE